jgi:hypothetical protein
MRKHFYELKNPCSDETGIELTDEIKEHVLKNQKYVPPKQEKSKIVNQTVTTYNFFNNLVTQLDFGQKIDLLMDHQKQKLIDFEDGLSNRFETRIQKLENDQYPNGYYLDEDGFLKIIDGVTKIDKDSLQMFNILFDKTVRRLKLYSCGDWGNLGSPMTPSSMLRQLSRSTLLSKVNRLITNKRFNILVLSHFLLLKIWTASGFHLLSKLLSL